MAGLVPEGAERAALRETYIANLAWAAKEAQAVGLDVLIEPINTRDIPGYFLNRQDHAHEIIAAHRRAQPEGADGPVPLPDRRGRCGDEDPQVPADPRTPVASATFRSPACRSGTNPTSASCTTPTCSTCSMNSAGRATSAANTGPRRARRPAWAGSNPTNHSKRNDAMKLLITGGGGFVGSRLASALLARGQLAGKTIKTLVLADQVAPRPELLADARVQARTGALLSQCAAFREESFDGVFHLASAVSGECEADFDLGLRSNLDSTRALLDALRLNVGGGGHAALRVLQLGGGVRAGRRRGDAPGGGRRHAARAADVVRHAKTDLRTPGVGLHPQGLHRRPLGAPDDGHGAPGPAERRRVVILLRHHPRAARRRRGDPARSTRACRTRCRRRRTPWKA